MAALSGPDFMLVMFQTIPFSTAAQYAFVVVPTFILMGNLAAASGMIESMFNAAASWLAGRRGALYIAVTFASAGFATVSGSTVVNAAVFSRIALPHMLRLGYARGVSGACIAAAGTFAVMIPPSLGFVIYGIMTGESVGRLFMAGVVPGLLTVIGYVVTINLMVRWRPEIAPRDELLVPLRQRVTLLRPLWSFALLVFISSAASTAASSHPQRRGPSARSAHS